MKQTNKQTFSLSLSLSLSQGGGSTGRRVAIVAVVAVAVVVAVVVVVVVPTYLPIYTCIHTYIHIIDLNEWEGYDTCNTKIALGYMQETAYFDTPLQVSNLNQFFSCNCQNSRVGGLIPSAVSPEVILVVYCL